MINSILKYALIAAILILLQILLFNNIQFSGYINPYVYIMIILLLPSVIPSWLLLLISFFTGLIIDLFMGSPGMHASATLLAGFSRPYVLSVIAPRDGYEPGVELSMQTYGFRWFLVYASVIVFIHHLALFYLEVFRFTGFFRTLLRVVLSSAFTTAFILLAERYRKR
ncbi:MAG TPA: rod shape-determining protein MreD [Bacteroidales bacterium]|jgi:rod shape-determining protein MreD|nr:rod shape-determining protein MreD [Bacteroidales bacterium]HNR41225.1 rod shape-determining protein MreD [Bacteroidales bacterium]HQG77036.1 rod shape-determining protein MreD [Bacteroidales bacterium]